MKKLATGRNGDPGVAPVRGKMREARAKGMAIQNRGAASSPIGSVSGGHRPAWTPGGGRRSRCPAHSNPLK